jgi:hypothetical protein
MAARRRASVQQPGLVHPVEPGIEPTDSRIAPGGDRLASARCGDTRAAARRGVHPSNDRHPRKFRAAADAPPWRVPVRQSGRRPRSSPCQGDGCGPGLRIRCCGEPRDCRRVVGAAATMPGRRSGPRHDPAGGPRSAAWPATSSRRFTARRGHRVRRGCAGHCAGENPARYGRAARGPGDGASDRSS